MDLFPAVITFLGCLLVALDIGIIIGIASSVVLLLLHEARPKIDVTKKRASQI